MIKKAPVPIGTGPFLRIAVLSPRRVFSGAQGSVRFRSKRQCRVFFFQPPWENSVI